MTDSVAGFQGVGRVNQLANFAFLKWPAGKKPNTQSPLDYFPQLWEDHVPTKNGTKIRFLHALPGGWERLEYDEFLDRRRKHIATVIRTAFDTLRTAPPAVPGATDRPAWSGPTVTELIVGEESFEVEFKQTGVGRHPESGNRGSH